MSDKATIIKTAQAFAAKGQFEKAIAEWVKLKGDSPTDGTVSNTIGDLYLKRNANRDAIEAFYDAAARFKAGGTALKAIAVYKKILKLDPKQYRAYQEVGDLNAGRGLVSNAVLDYQTLAKLYMKEAKWSEAHRVYAKMLALDPSHPDAAARFEELCAKHNLPRDLPGGEASQAAPAPAAPAPATTSVSPRRPKETDDDEAKVAWAAELVRKGKYEEAEAALMELLSLAPADRQVIRLLAVTHLKRGEVASARGEVHYLADAAMQGQDYATAEELIQEYLAVDGTDAPMTELLARVYEAKGDREHAGEQYAKSVERLREQNDPDMVEHLEELCTKLKTLVPDHPLICDSAASHDAEEPASAEPAEPATTQPAEPATADAGQPGEDFHSHFELGMAYKNMGLLTEAVEEFEVAMRSQQYYLDSCRLLATCLSENGQLVPAIKCLEQVVEDPRCEGERSLWIRYDLAVLYELDGQLDRARALLATIPTFLDASARLQRLQHAGQA